MFWVLKSNIEDGSLKLTLNPQFIIIVILLFMFCGFSWADEGDLIWSTFLGGSDYDLGYGIAVDGEFMLPL